MNGPQHYAEAERVTAAALSEQRAQEEGFSYWPREELLALAQVHATLAQVAATANVTRNENTNPLVDAPGAWDNGHNGDGLTWQEALR